ncbi:MAG: ammonia permease, partial [Oscillospiraceae bacterium]|nr:ammonia permease [Oscillospiraceae bacterium]
GLFFGDARLFLAQLASIAITIAISAILTFAILFVLKKLTTIRVSQTAESQGLDISEHSESAYPAFTGLD